MMGDIFDGLFRLLKWIAIVIGIAVLLIGLGIALGRC